MGTSQFQALRSLSSTLIIWPQNSPILIYAKKIVGLCQIAKMFDSDCDPIASWSAIMAVATM